MRKKFSQYNNLVKIIFFLNEVHFVNNATRSPLILTPILAILTCFGALCVISWESRSSRRRRKHSGMGTKERKERERQKRSNDILEAALRQFESKGFLNTTLQDVAKEAEISVGLIYRHFQSKEDIFASLALRGAEQLDEELETIFANAGRQNLSAQEVLYEVAHRVLDYYGPYGEYFDMLIYSYKGLKTVQIKAATLTKLMGLTLASLDKLKNFIQSSPDFEAQDDDDALRVVLLLWGILLGTHKLFDPSGRGRLFAFQFEPHDFVRQMIGLTFKGVSKSKSAGGGSSRRKATASAPPQLSV